MYVSRGALIDVRSLTLAKKTRWQTLVKSKLTSVTLLDHTSDVVLSFAGTNCGLV